MGGSHVILSAVVLGLWSLNLTLPLITPPSSSPPPTFPFLPQVVMNEVVLDRGISPFLTNLEAYCDDIFVTHVQVRTQGAGSNRWGWIQSLGLDGWTRDCDGMLPSMGSPPCLPVWTAAEGTHLEL